MRFGFSGSSRGDLATAILGIQQDPSSRLLFVGYTRDSLNSRGNNRGISNDKPIAIADVFLTRVRQAVEFLLPYCSDFCLRNENLRIRGGGKMTSKMTTLKRVPFPSILRTSLRLATRVALALAMVLGSVWLATITTAQDQTIDAAKSTLKIRVFKSGLFSAFGHNHEIAAPIAEGTVHLSGDASVRLAIHARELRVLDPEVSAKERGDVQKTMEGPQVLDVERFPEIAFQSTAVQKKDDKHWTIRGNLTLHGQTSPVQVDVTNNEGHYAGSARLLQHDFGMTPISIAGGSVKVKDEVRIEFDVVLK